jgi:hypothetical protein
MTATANSDYSVITMNSANLTTFVGVDSVTLYGTINCTGDYSDTIVSGDVDGSGNWTLDSTTLFSEAALDDGIYGFKLVISKTDDSVITEHTCLFVDNETTCNVATEVSTTGETDLAMYAYILSNAQNCDCDCSDLCVIYKKILNELSDCTSC